MSVFTVTPAEAVERLAAFSAVIDARSEAEHALDHLPGAVNWPSLNNAERIEVGTMYKQVSPFEARKRGAALVARNIAAHIEREVQDKPKNWQPLVYCWRGGQRSHSLALVLGQIGFRVALLEGGYKAFRGLVIAQTPELAARLSWRVVCGPTGSGKTRLLAALAEAGAQALDLEALACHRSSVLGRMPGQPQPSQKHFETRLWQALRQFDPARPVYVEAESRKVGNLAVPGALIEAMRAAPCLSMELPDDNRVALLLEDYAHFTDDPTLFQRRLEVLRPRCGREVVSRWQALVQAGAFAQVVRELLTEHYDPGYAASTRSHFVQFAGARSWLATDHSPGAMRSLAQQILAGESP